jgi:hypothetical protein
VKSCSSRSEKGRRIGSETVRPFVPHTFTKRRCSEFRPCQFAPQIWDDLLRSIARIPFSPLAHRRHPKMDCSYYRGKKLSRATGSTPARAAQGMGTSCCGNSCFKRNQEFQAAQRIWTAVRRWRMITVVWWCRLAPLCRLARCGHRHLLRLCLASDHAHPPAVCLSSLRSYYLS